LRWLPVGQQEKEKKGRKIVLPSNTNLLNHNLRRPKEAEGVGKQLMREIILVAPRHVERKHKKRIQREIPFKRFLRGGEIKPKQSGHQNSRSSIPLPRDEGKRTKCFTHKTGGEIAQRARGEVCDCKMVLNSKTHKRPQARHRERRGGYLSRRLCNSQNKLKGKNTKRTHVCRGGLKRDGDE